MLDLCLLGTGGMMPLPNRWLTSLITKYNGKGLLIDCGEATQIAIREAGWSVHDIDVICFTHYHGDHISGLPGLLLSMGNADRTEPVLLVGPKGLERVVGCLRVVAPELPFELIFHEITENEETILCNGYRVEAFRVNHNVICYGYSIVIDRAGKFDPEKAARNNVPMRLWSRLQKGAQIEEDGRTFTQDMILGPARKGIKLTYCTDTRPVDIIVGKAAGADLFICEGMYGDNEKEEKAVKRKHMTFEEAAGLAARAEVRELWLTHYSPSLVRPDLSVNSAKEIFQNTVACRDGRSLTIRFDDDPE